MRRAILGNVSNLAVVDSYLGDFREIGAEAQGIVAYWTPGPIKIVNNFIEAATENIMFGGAGGWNNPYVPSDIEIRNNYLFKPLSWVPLSVIAGQRQLAVKNAFEVKSGQRILFDGNTIENVWANAQNGFAIVLTVRSQQSGDLTVINDITVTNNVLKNVVSGFNTLAKDDTCNPATTPNCHNAGSQTRWYIANNLMTFYDPALPGGLRNWMISIAGGMDRVNGNTPGVLRDVVFQHNTGVPPASAPCNQSIYFNLANIMPGKPGFVPLTDNLWFLDNVFCKQPSGDGGLQGTAGLMSYMGNPSTPPNDLAHRFYGNAMYVPSGAVQPFPPHNYPTTVPFTYVNPAIGNFQLVTPYWTDTSDGKLAGVDTTLLILLRFQDETKYD